MITVESGIP